MIVVDTSAILAILLREPEAESFSDVLGDNLGVMGAPTRVETLFVVSGRLGAIGVVDRERLFADTRIRVIPFDARMDLIARDAFDRFGRGRTGLNFGDCLSYAVAKALDAPLLYKGLDFATTDVASAAG